MPATRKHSSTSPQIVKDAEHLYVLQRTPQYSIPAWNAPIPPVTSASTAS
jgi:hypothetical protein